MWSKTCEPIRNISCFWRSLCVSSFHFDSFLLLFFQNIFFIFWARVCLSIIDYDIRYCLSSHCIFCLMPSSTRIKKQYVCSTADTNHFLMKSLEISRGQSESVIWRKKIYGPNIIHKTLQKKIKIEKHEPH